MSDDGPASASPLIRALAEAALGAAWNIQRQLRYAIERAEPLFEACACREDIGLQRCDCRVVLGMGPRWMRSAAMRVAHGQYVGPPPKRRCRLCRAGEHDLIDTHEVTVSVAGQPMGWTVRMISPSRRTNKHMADRAARAGAYPPSALDDQRRAAGWR